MIFHLILLLNLDRMCQPNPCMNGGTCVEDGDKFKCVCLPWTSGNLCEGNVNINKIYTNFIKFLLLYSFEIL